MKLLRETIRRLLKENREESYKEETMAMLQREFPDCTFEWGDSPDGGFEIHHKMKDRLWEIKNELEEADHYVSIPFLTARPWGWKDETGDRTPGYHLMLYPPLQFN